MKLKTLIKKIWDAIGKFFNRMEDETKRLVPVAIKVVEGVKSVIDSPVDDIIAEVIKKSIKGEVDDIIIDKIKLTVETWIPKILLELKMIESIANIEDTNEQLKVILEQFRFSSDETKNIFYHGLSCLILEKLSDGKLSWSDAIAISEYYYKNVVKK